MASVDHISFGLLEDMIAEVAAFDPRTIDVLAADAKWLVMPVGDAQYDTSWHPSRAAACTEARRQAAHFGVVTRCI